MSLPAKLTLALVTVIAGVTAFVVYSAGGTEHRAAELDEMAHYGLEEREGATRMRLLVVDADYGLGADGFEGGRQDFDTYIERLDGIVNEIAINNPDVVVIYDVPFEGGRVYDQDLAALVAAESEMPYLMRTVSWSSRNAMTPLFPPGQQAGRIQGGVAVVSRFPIVEATGDVLRPDPRASLLERFFVPRSSLTEAIIEVGDERVLISVMDLLGSSPMPTRTAENEDAFAQLLVRRVDGVNLGARGPFEIRTEDQMLSVVRDPNVDVLRSAIDSDLQGRVTSQVISAELGFVEAVVLDPSQMVNRTGPRMEIFIDENGTRIEYPEQVEGSGAPALVNVQDLLAGSGQGAPDEATPPDDAAPAEDSTPGDEEPPSP